MTQPRQWTIAIGVVMALVFGTALVIKIRPQIDLLGVGSSAPDFHATNLRTRRPTTLADYRGKVVLLNVWATWCQPCRVEMPSMERIYRRLGQSGDFKVVAVSVDEQDDSVVAVFARSIPRAKALLRGELRQRVAEGGIVGVEVVGQLDEAAFAEDPREA